MSTMANYITYAINSLYINRIYNVDLVEFLLFIEETVFRDISKTFEKIPLMLD